MIAAADAAVIVAVVRIVVETPCRLTEGANWSIEAGQVVPVAVVVIVLLGVLSVLAVVMMELAVVAV